MQPSLIRIQFQKQVEWDQLDVTSQTRTKLTDVRLRVDFDDVSLNVQYLTVDN